MNNDELDISYPQLKINKGIMLEYLSYVDKICRDNNIEYSLVAGTLLGAVRHKGFIPWDDDVDIALPRSDYERLIKIMSEPKEGFYIEKDLWIYRLKNSNHLEKDPPLMLDIFTFDNVPDGKIHYLCKKLVILMLQGMIKKNPNYKKYSFGGKILSFVTQCLGMVFASRSKNRAYDRVIQWGNRNETRYVNAFNMGYEAINQRLPQKILGNYKDIQFEGLTLRAITDTDTYLTVRYGEYMKFPPEEQRVPVHLKPIQ